MTPTKEDGLQKVSPMASVCSPVELGAPPALAALAQARCVHAPLYKRVTSLSRVPEAAACAE